MLLEQVKKSASPHDATILLESEFLRKVVSTWDKVPLVNLGQFDINQDYPSVKAMWEHVTEEDIQFLSLASGLTMAKCKPSYNQAVACRLIYPDGTINAYAGIYLASLILPK